MPPFKSLSKKLRQYSNSGPTILRSINLKKWLKLKRRIRRRVSDCVGQG
jgi:hypothetical protein